MIVGCDIEDNLLPTSQPIQRRLQQPLTDTSSLILRQHIDRLYPVLRPFLLRQAKADNPFCFLGDPQVTTTSTHPRGAMLRAYDKQTGQEVGAIWMPAPQSGSPMTYSIEGKQYIVVAVSGGAYSGAYIAYSLPSE